ncbi:hypothetical protein BDZ97DRAFT_624702 [Flammula alnicola]|nr:hypothetical protein BDZ97DRAFT_624702 [Flammula alnicola]
MQLHTRLISVIPRSQRSTITYVYPQTPRMIDLRTTCVTTASGPNSRPRLCNIHRRAHPLSEQPSRRPEAQGNRGVLSTGYRKHEIRFRKKEGGWRACSSHERAQLSDNASSFAFVWSPLESHAAIARLQLERHASMHAHSFVVPSHWKSSSSNAKSPRDCPGPYFCQRHGVAQPWGKPRDTSRHDQLKRHSAPSI